VGGVWAPNTQGKTLEEIEVERYGTAVEGFPERVAAVEPPSVRFATRSRGRAS